MYLNRKSHPTMIR